MTGGTATIIGRYAALTDAARHVRDEAILNRLRHRRQPLDGPNGVAREFAVTPRLARRLRRARKAVLQGLW